MPVWRLWFEQVKHGKPFSFKGDMRVYTLVDLTQANPPRQERRTKPKEGEADTANGNRSRRIEIFVVLFLLALAVIIAASRVIRKSGVS